MFSKEMVVLPSRGRFIRWLKYHGSQYSYCRNFL